MKWSRIAVLALVTAGCATAREAADEAADVAERAAREVRQEVTGPRATARLINAQGANVGTVTLEQQANGVEIEVHATGLTPGVHGFHVHEVGTCTPPDFNSAGGHFNPTQRQHGFESPQGPHAGDMRNLQVGADGVAHAEVVNERITLRDGPNSVFDANGSAIVIHAQPDDYRTNPSGNAGARVACGVITR